MESDILKFICANQGAVDADELMFNLFPGASTNEVISNQLKFVLYSSNGQQKVVAKTSLKLCRIKDCLGSCGQLHLCKNLLFSGLCQRRVCGFCHELNSCYNQWLLKQHELEALSRAELCTLLLQSDNTLLPPICYDYNTGYDEFGRCQSGVACSRLHICKKYLSGDCRCPKSHDFFAPQPLKSLYDRGVPDNLIRSLRSVYANNEALRISSNRTAASPTYTTATSEVGLHLDKRQGYRGRGRGGNSGHRGYKGNSENRGKLLQPQQPSSCSYLLGNTDGFTLYSKKSLNEYGNVQEDLNSSSSDLSTAGSDTKSRDRGTVKPRHRNRQKHRGTRGSREKGTNLGNPPQQQQSDSLNDVPANSEASDLNTERGPNEEDNRQREPNSPSSDALTVGKDASAESGCGFKVEQKKSNQGRETGGNRGNGTNLGNPPQQQQSASLNDAPANSDASDLNIEDKVNEGDCQQLDLNSPSRDVSAAGKDINTKSNNGFMVEQRQWNQGREDSGGNAGQSLQQQQQTSALSDISAEVGSLDLNGKAGLSVGDSQQQGLNSAKSNVLAGGKDTDRGNSSGQSRQQAKDQNQASAVTGRGGEQDNQQQQLHRSSPADLSAAADSKDRNGGDVLKKKPKPVKDKTEICMYFIKGYCKHDDQCVKAHDRMPYRWQVLEGGLWTNLPHNEAIEKDYCDPKNKHSSGSPVVHFDTMTCGANRIRRLSTLNSLVEPDFIHTTEWLWYWQDEFGKWNLYGSDNRRDSADISSSKLEQKFLDNEKDVVDFRAGSQSYTLSFQDMIQTNKYYGTKKLVSRRPLFVSAEDVKTKKVRKSSNSTSVPDTWDKTQIPQTGFSRVTLQRSSDEYLKVEALFCSTMKGFDIIEIERIQNKALWEVFQWQKNLMKNNNGGRDVTERLLFHGTESKYVDAICLNNFDWRICGTHGTVYGKGSYFARDAMYSHCYTGDTPVRTMFVSRVLLGSYTRGASSYVRPPSKDGGDVHFYDSCVDNVADPSIFVVFEKHQIYPKYLIQYWTADPLNDTSGSVSAAPAPTKCVIT